MNNDSLNTKRTPYKGVWLVCLFLLLLPLFVALIFYISFKKFTGYSVETITYMSLFVGYAIGVLFEISCAIAGLFKGTLSVIIARIIDFFGNVKISFKFAIGEYFYSVKYDGIVFWIYLLVIGFTTAVAIYTGNVTMHLFD